MIEHASRCEDCVVVIDAANETFHDEGGNAVHVARGQWERWLVACAPRSSPPGSTRPPRTKCSTPPHGSASKFGLDWKNDGTGRTKDAEETEGLEASP